MYSCTGTAYVPSPSARIASSVNSSNSPSLSPFMALGDSTLNRVCIDKVVDARMGYSFSMFWSLVQDVRYTLRQMRRAPAFAVSAVLTLGLGIGANTGIFSLLNGYMRPLPLPDPDRIVVIAAEMPGDETGFRYRFSVNDYRAETTAFSDVFAYDSRIAGLTARGRTTQFVFHAVTGNFFSGLGVTPILGRTIERGEGERTGSENVVVLGYSFWQRRFGGDPSVVGEIVRVDGQASRIIGVAPPGFYGLYQGLDIEGYVPLGGLRGRAAQSGRLFNDRTLRFLTLVARLRPDVTVK